MTTEANRALIAALCDADEREKHIATKSLSCFLRCTDLLNLAGLTEIKEAQSRNTLSRRKTNLIVF
jgi:hypothetical protein